MKLSHFLLLLFIFIAVVEIYFFILVGEAIGVWPTLALVVLSAIIGIQLLQNRSVKAIQQARNMAENGQLPTEPLIRGILSIISGFLLLLPGFFTDILGLILLLKLPKNILIAWLESRMRVHVQQTEQAKPKREPVIIEGEYKRESDD